MWPHFESFYVLHQPTYSSKYPPGQGLLLALGRLAGAPIVGAWLGVAAMCAATVWMLRGYLAPRWASFGGVLLAVHLAWSSYWSQSYWGGALAATGGALVFGALPRILKRRPGRVRTSSALILAAGLLVLAITRPFEGALVSLAAALVLGAWLVRREDRQRRWLRVGAPLLATLAIGLIALGLYNRAVTGDALRMPFSLYDEQYHARPLFVWQSMRPDPEYRHDILRRYFVGVEVREVEEQRHFEGWARLRLRRLERTRSVLLGPVLTAPLLFLPLVWRARGVRLAVAGVALLLVAVAVTNHHFPHYAAPALGLVLLLAIQGWRWSILRVRRRGLDRRLAMTLVVVATLIARLGLPDPVIAVGRARSANRAKATVEASLEREGGRHLVFVRHGPYSDVHDDWVSNGADIDAGRIVYARAMTPEQDSELRAYYPDRRAWRVEIGRDRPGVVDFEAYGEPSPDAAPDAGPNTSVTPP
jgi:hypothetical protein